MLIYEYPDKKGEESKIMCDDDSDTENTIHMTNMLKISRHGLRLRE